jgi:hypothetical protein
MLSLDAYMMLKEWRGLKDCTKNRQGDAQKIGIPIAAKTPHPMKKIPCCLILATLLGHIDKIFTRI